MFASKGRLVASLRMYTLLINHGISCLDVKVKTEAIQSGGGAPIKINVELKLLNDAISFVIDNNDIDRHWQRSPPPTPSYRESGILTAEIYDEATAH